MGVEHTIVRSRVHVGSCMLKHRKPQHEQSSCVGCKVLAEEGGVYQDTVVVAIMKRLVAVECRGWVQMT